ncbi:MAG: amino acid ABC transporter permease [Caulobacteraceae bacterium]|nr:amino acid ABC transporter permease [Caulobacteraceae bacterium]
MSDAAVTRAPRLAPRLTAWQWARQNLFGSVADSILTVVVAIVFGWLVWHALDWAVIRADWFGESKEACKSGGACWAVITARWRQVVAGYYPEGHLYRVALAMLFLAVAVFPVVKRDLPAWSALLAPVGVIAAIAILGGANILPSVPTDYWGGIMLNVLVGLTGAIFALPIGILLAFGRRSDLPIIKAFSIGFIEIIRGVPLITLLFMSSVVLPLFLPAGVNLDKLMRALAVVTLFSSAYMAEAVRGGLQSVPKGQREAAHALGLGLLQTTGLVVLPQAIRISIPAIVNTFIGLFKDTSLLYVIAILEVTGVIRQALSDFSWLGLENEGYVFVAFVFWVACFSMSRWSASLEKQTGKEAKPAREPA